VLHFHRQHNADVTLVYKKLPEARPGKAYVVNVAADGRITGIAEKDARWRPGIICSWKRCSSTAVSLPAVRQAYAQGKQNFFTDVIGAELKRLRVFGYRLFQLCGPHHQYPGLLQGQHGPAEPG
jgi:glucose-1-phosphate adenylyltransferase